MKDAVSIIIFNDEKDQVLLIKRRDIPVWVLPGGGIDPGETPEAAAVREALEETGCAVRLLYKSAFYTPQNRLSAPTHVYTAHIESGTLKTGPETKEIAFFPLHSLPKHFPPFYRHFIHDALHSTTTLHKPIKGTSYLHLLYFLFTHPTLTFRFLLTRLGIHINS